MTPRPRGQAGFTMTEVAIAIAVLATSLAAFGRVFTGTQNLAYDSRARIRAQEEHRRSLEALADAVRGASVTSFTGFAVDGTSSNPTYQRVTGLSGSTRVLESPEQLQWVAVANIDDVSGPGRVMRIQNGVARVLADRVPFGGFVVTLQGNVLRIRLTTTYSTSQRKVASVTAEIAVSVRN